MTLKGNPFLGKLRIPVPNLDKHPPVKKYPLLENTALKENEDVSLNTQNCNSAVITPNAGVNIEKRDYTYVPLSSSDFLANHQQIASKPLANHQQTASDPLETNKHSESKVIIYNKNEQEIAAAANHQQTASESPANNEQTASESLANNQQITSKPLANRLSQKQQIASKPPAKSPAKSLANRQQDLKDPSITFLQGLQRKIVEYLYIDCNSWGTRTTRPISGSEFAQHLECDIKTAKNALDRLSEKKIIIRAKSFPGRLGSTIYELPENIYREFVDFQKRKQLKENSLETTSKPLAKSLAKPPATHSSSGSKISSSDLKPLQTEKKQMSQEWLDLDWKSLSSMGLQLYHIRQIFDAGLVSAEDVEESIQQMHHDLTSGGKHGLKNPLAVFMKQLKVKGERYTVSTPGFVSDEMRYEKKRLEEMQRQQGEIEQIKTQQQEILNRDCVEKENEEFQAWMSMKTPEELKALAGNFNIQLPSGQGMLKNAYREERAFIREQISKELPT